MIYIADRLATVTQEGCTVYGAALFLLEAVRTSI